MPESRILILGSGHISGCLLHYLINVLGYLEARIILASLLQEELEERKENFPGIEVIQLDAVNDTSGLEKVVRKSNLVVSLLPNHLHLPVVKQCILSGIHLVHASYNTKEIIALNEEAILADVLILGEMGLDPGIDHMLAMKSIDEVTKGRGQVVSFRSYCGGLPDPECKGDNPLKYKFSWAPKTALKNLMNPARFVENKKRELISFLHLKKCDGSLDDIKVAVGKDYPILQGLGLLSEALVDKLETPFEALAKHLERTLKFRTGEQDVVILHKEIEAKYPPLSSTSAICGKTEIHEVDFIVYGDNEFSAMAKTVAFTLGIAVDMILNNQIPLRGVHIPTNKEIYLPVLHRLSTHGLFAIEKIRPK